MEVLTTILQFSSGIGLFLFGLKLMSNTLEKLGTNKIKKNIGRVTKNRVRGTFFGVLITAVLQSSTAVTVLSIGFVSAGMMTLTQAIPIILGSNLGTVFTQAIVSLNVLKLTTVFAGLGGVFAMIFLFTKNKKTREIMTALMGFSMMFAGIGLMGAANLINTFFADVIIGVSNPLLLVIIGFIFCVLVQSSLGSVVVLMGVMTAAGGEISIFSAAYILIGINIGTTMTALLASLSGNQNAKRAAVFHIAFSVAGGMIFGLLVLPFGVAQVLEMISDNPSTQVVLFNLVFNLAMILLILPFITPITRLLMRVIKDKPVKVEKYMLEQDVLEVPSVAVFKLSTFLPDIVDDIEKLIRTSLFAYGLDGKRLISLEEFSLRKDEIEKNAGKIISQTTRLMGSLVAEDQAKALRVSQAANELVGMLRNIFKTYEVGLNLDTMLFKEYGKDAKRFLEVINESLSDLREIILCEEGAECRPKESIVLTLLEKEVELTKMKAYYKETRQKQAKTPQEIKEFTSFMNTINHLESVSEKIVSIAISWL
ncbi:MAG: Na/Pi symporter [Firmicutes bacterium]|nr:Na/Pi symporter [Bacillota bacterium]MCL2771137.1 Na/Pi symporter [Bacillota bacterium]